MSSKRDDTSKLDALLASVTEDMLGDDIADQFQEHGLRVERILLELVRPDPIQPRRVLLEQLHQRFHNGQLTPTQALRELTQKAQVSARQQGRPFANVLELLPDPDSEADTPDKLSPEEETLRDLVNLAVTIRDDGQVNPLTVVDASQGVTRLYRDELDTVIRFLDPDREKQLSDETVSVDPSQFTSPNYFAGLYRAKVIEFKGRNDALFYTACQMRDAGFSQSDVIGSLADLHAKQPPVGAHAAESYEQRYREAESTINSVFSRPARQPFSPTPPKQDDASYLPNTLREEILIYNDGAACLRTLEALILCDVQPGDESSEPDRLKSRTFS